MKNNFKLEIEHIHASVDVHFRLLSESRDLSEIVSSHNTIAVLISEITRSFCLDSDQTLEKKVSLLFIAKKVEDWILLRSTERIESVLKLNHPEKPNQTEDLNHYLNDINRVFNWDRKCNEPIPVLSKAEHSFLNPKSIECDWIYNNLKSASRYTKQRIVSDLILMAVVADHWDRRHLDIEFCPKEYSRYIFQLQYGNSYEIALCILSAIPLFSNLLIPSVFQKRLDNPKTFEAQGTLVAATFYFEKMKICDRWDPKKHRDMIISFLFFDYLSSTHFEILKMYFNQTIELNQFALNMLFSSIYPPILRDRKTKKKATAFFTNNWDMLKSENLKRLLNG